MKNLCEQLAEKIGQVLKEQGLTLAVAESCTAGGLSFAITRIAGSSAWFERGFVTYSNEAKVEMLGVNPKTIADFGAVSKETALQMAEGALEMSHADVSIATTGIAGPSGGSKEKPVGTVWIAFAAKKKAPEVYLEVFPGGREAVREAAILSALKSLLDFIDH